MSYEGEQQVRVYHVFVNNKSLALVAVRSIKEVRALVTQKLGRCGIDIKRTDQYLIIGSKTEAIWRYF